MVKATTFTLHKELHKKERKSFIEDNISTNLFLKIAGAMLFVGELVSPLLSQSDLESQNFIVH